MIKINKVLIPKERIAYIEEVNNQTLQVTFIDKTTLFVEGTLKSVEYTNNETIIKAIQYLKDNREYQEEICDECIAILNGE